MSKQAPQPGLVELMTYLHQRGLRKALCTRNFPAPVQHLLDTFLSDEERVGVFEPVITRDSEGIRAKPSPEGLWRISEAWGDLDVPLDTNGEVDENLGANREGKHEFEILEAAKKYLGAGLIMVGDSIDDMAAGYRAGAATVLLANEENEHLVVHEYTGLSVRRLDELIGVLEGGFQEGVEG
jgi:phosphoglycolate phosphatase-like HAD superfamily hydrolase